MIDSTGAQTAPDFHDEQDVVRPMPDQRWEDFTGRTVVVSGCSSGIGAATADQLLARGARVIGLDLNSPAVPGIEYVEVDLASSASIERALASLDGEVHGLVNAAGVSAGINDPLKVVSINFAGLRELTEGVVERMPPDSYVVNTSSLAAADYALRLDLLRDLVSTADREQALQWCREHPDALGNGYALSKEAVIAYTSARCVAFAQRGIRINCTAPGVTDTPILRHSVASVGQAYLDAIPKPLGRIATPEEQASVLVFLASPGASYLTGQVLWVDGGYTAGVAAGEIEPMALKR